jgi:hypothetical protein
MSRTAVVLCSRRMAAESVKERLATAGVHAELQEHFGLQRLWFVARKSAGTRVEVDGPDLERACHLLQQWGADPSALPGVIRCPECRSLRVAYPQFASHSVLTNLALGIVAELGLVEKDYYCEDCHYTWPREGQRPRRQRSHLGPYYFIEGIDQTDSQAGPGPARAGEEPRKAA